MIDVTSYGAVGDGVTNDTTAVTNALAALPATGGELYFPAGTYLLSTWTPKDIGSSTPPPAPNDEIGGVRLRGEAPGAVLLRGPGTTLAANSFGRIRTDLAVSGLEFENWHIVFDGTGAGSVNEVSFVDCAFRDSAYFLEWTASEGDFVSRLVVDRCDFRNLTTAVFFANVDRGEVYFTRSRIVDCQRYGMRLLSTDEEAGNGLVVFSRNFVSNLNAELFTPQYAVARVIQVACERLVVTENLVKGVRSKVGGGNANFAYTSSLHAYIAGNWVEDVGIPGDPTSGAIIHEKNTNAISGRYLDNHFVQNPPPEGVDPLRASGIEIQHRGHVVVHGNEARGLHNSFLLALLNLDQLVVSNNIITDEDSQYGSIVVYGGRNVVIESNVIDGVENTYDPDDVLVWHYIARGIRIERSSQTVIVEGQPTTVLHAPKNVRISNNVINSVRRADADEGSAIFIYANSIEIENLSIVGNTITDSDIGVDLRTAGGTFGDVELSYNTFRDNRVNVNVPTAPASFMTRQNRGWATEAAGTATVGAAATSVTVTHGLERTPALSGITVTPQANLNAAARFWVSNATATTFTINVNVAPGTAVDFGWTAQVL